MRILTIIILIINSGWLQAQTVSSSFMHGGISRDYAVYLPTNFSASDTYPVVLNLHGYGSNGAQQALVSEMNDVADTANFLVVYPEGTLDATFTTFWNANYGATVDDIGFLNALLDTLISNYNIDTNRIYSTGYSNGAIMSNTLACATNRFAAIAGVAGTMSYLQKSICNPTSQIPVMHIHGTADAVVAYTGNSLLIGVDSLIAHWVGINNLNATPTTTVIPDINFLDLCTATKYDYEPAATYPVRFIKVTSGRHTWPGSAIQTGGGTCQDFDASVEIWRFFSQQQKPTPIRTVRKTESPFITIGKQQPSVVAWVTDEPDYQLKIYNTLGQVVKTQTFHESGYQEIRLIDRPKGTYFLVFSTNKQIQTFIQN